MDDKLTDTHVNFFFFFFFFFSCYSEDRVCFFLLWAALADLGGSLLYSTYPIIPALHPLINYSDTTLHPLPPPDPTVLFFLASGQAYQA